MNKTVEGQNVRHIGLMIISVELICEIEQDRS